MNELSAEARPCHKLERGNLSTYFDISRVSRTYQLILTYLTVGNEQATGSPTCGTSFKGLLTILLEYVRAGLKPRQCLSERQTVFNTVYQGIIKTIIKTSPSPSPRR